MDGAEEPNTGEWFAIDYHAIGLGECRVFFSERPALPSPEEIEDPKSIVPVLVLVNESVFTHVQTRDFDNNYVVDFSDFALMALHLQNSEGNDPNIPSDPNDVAYQYDFDQNQSIDAADLSMFLDFWLARTR